MSSPSSNAARLFTIRIATLAALLAAGVNADSIIHWLENNDYESAPFYRQYGVVTLAGPNRAAGYTGVSTDPWNGHIVGPSYAIQGNILLGEQILDTIEFAFLNTPGPLEDKLMAALEAADVRGADTRCTACNKPAISAFIKVIHPGDGGTPYLYTFVDHTECATDPIPLLRQQFNTWRALQAADPSLSLVTAAPFWLRAGTGNHATVTVTPHNSLNNPLPPGAIVTLAHTGTGTLSAVTDNGNGTFTATLTAGPAIGIDSVIASVTSGGHTVILNQKPTVAYYKCGDVNNDQKVNVGDAVYLINCIFKGGPCPSPMEIGDVNCDSKTNVGDAVYTINYVFKFGIGPCVGSGCQ